MNPKVYSAIAALPETDQTVPSEEKEAILRFCKGPTEHDRQTPGRLMRPAEAIKRLGISRCTLWRMVKEGHIEVVQLRRDGVRLYKSEQIDAMTQMRK